MKLEKFWQNNKSVNSITKHVYYWATKSSYMEVPFSTQFLFWCISLDDKHLSADTIVLLAWPNAVTARELFRRWGTNCDIHPR